MGREYLSRYGKPILYFSEEAHYSISSLALVLDLDYCKIKAEVSGEMSCEDLEKKLDVTRPALFSLSIGTTFKGGVDRIEKVDEVVKRKGVTQVFYHADAALFGGFLPFLKDERAPSLSFKQFPYDSIAVSGHKFFGSPVPLGMFLTQEKYIHALQGEYIQYIETHNLTIPCSRSSLNTLIFWWTLSTKAMKTFEEESAGIIQRAEMLYNELKKRHYPAWLNPFSNTVYFLRPSPSICHHWS
jgi:histidine decarboxylase